MLSYVHDNDNRRKVYDDDDEDGDNFDDVTDNNNQDIYSTKFNIQTNLTLDMVLFSIFIKLPSCSFSIVLQGQILLMLLKKNIRLHKTRVICRKERPHKIPVKL